MFTLFGLGEGAKWRPESFAKYRKNGLADLHKTLRLLGQLCKSSFEIKCLKICHSLLPW